MKKKRPDQRGNFIVYTIRIIVCFIVVGTCYLTICGCLHLFVFFTGNKKQSGSDLENADIKKDNPYAELPSITQKNIRIILDAGHGGKDVGTSYEEEKEKSINLAVVEKMKKILEQKGVTVVLTREKDEFISLDERVNMANQLEVDLFISIHCNEYIQDTSIKGLECYYMEGSLDGERYANSIIELLKERGNVETRNAKPESYRVLKNTKMLSVLIELGYISNREERKNLIDYDYQEKLAEELVECILQSMNKLE